MTEREHMGPMGISDAFDAAVGRVKEAPQGVAPGPGAPVEPDRLPKRGRGRPRGSKTRGGAGKGKSGWARWRERKEGTAPALAGTVEGPPPPADEPEAPAEPPEIVVEQWAGFVEKIDGLIVSTLETQPLTIAEARQGGRAVAILMDYYAPKMGAAAGPWGPLMLWSLTAYGPRAVELIERRIREYVIARRRKRLTAETHAASKTPAREPEVKGSPDTFREPGDPPGYVRVERH